MKLKTNAEKNCIRTQGTDPPWRRASQGGIPVPEKELGKSRSSNAPGTVRRPGLDATVFHFFVLRDISSGCTDHDLNLPDPGK